MCGGDELSVLVRVMKEEGSEGSNMADKKALAMDQTGKQI